MYETSICRPISIRFIITYDKPEIHVFSKFNVYFLVTCGLLYGEMHKIMLKFPKILKIKSRHV